MFILIIKHIKKKLNFKFQEENTKEKTLKDKQNNLHSKSYY